MLFDDDEQLEVRHVVSLAHHDISIYAGDKPAPEGELFIKRNAICLSRKPDGPELGPDSQLSKPFFLFSEHCSAKEDFYFALLRNQAQTFHSKDKPPSPIPFEVKNIISLVQKLHSSEEHLHTRWLNALIGRIFLGVYKTKDLENYIREMIEKKISRVKKPAFLSNVVLKAIDTGESGPFMTNPRLRDLTVEGECTIEADMRYTGNFRLEVEATVRIDLGARFKAREVNIVLAVVIRKVEGHMLFKIKPPPSNRIWFAFQQMPKLEMTIEPIVSSRQITYTVILRQIENRIKEVIAESLVLPFWDDLAFFRTEKKRWRGGIFDDSMESDPRPETVITPSKDVEEDQVEDGQETQEFDLPGMEKSYSAPILEQEKEPTGLFGRKLNRRKTQDPPSNPASASTTSVDIPGTPPSMAQATRSAYSANPSISVIGTDATNADEFKPSTPPPNDGAAIAAGATLSAGNPPVSITVPSPAVTPGSAPVSNPFKPYVTSKSSYNSSSSSSREATDTEKDLEQTPQQRRNTVSSTGSNGDNSAASSPSNMSTKGSVRSQPGSLGRGLFNRREPTNSTNPPVPDSPGIQKRTTLAAVTNAAASARRWGINALQRHNEAANNKSGASADGELDLNQPIGRGRPLPPPGQPLPMPDKRSKTASIPVPKRKPIASPPLLPREPNGGVEDQHDFQRRPVPPPPLPRRHAIDEDRGSTESLPLDTGRLPAPPLPKRQSPYEGTFDGGDNMLVVEAPADSEPTTPMSDHHPAYAPSWVENNEDDLIDMESTRGGPVHEAMNHEQGAAFRSGVHDDHYHGGQHQHDIPPTEVKPTSTSHEGNDSDDEFSAWMDNPGPAEPAPAMLRNAHDEAVR
jgi:hypothetical protein